MSINDKFKKLSKNEKILLAIIILLLIMVATQFDKIWSEAIRAFGRYFGTSKP
jgi:cell division protein FtsL